MAAFLLLDARLAELARSCCDDDGVSMTRQLAVQELDVGFDENESNGHSEIVKFLLENSETIDLDVNAHNFLVCGDFQISHLIRFFCVEQSTRANLRANNLVVLDF